MKDKVNKKIILICIGIVLLLILVLGLSYAAVEEMEVGGSNIISVSEGLDLKLDETNLILSNARPMTDDEGIEEGVSAVFTLHNWSNSVFSYAVNLDDIKTDIPRENIRYTIKNNAKETYVDKWIAKEKENVGFSTPQSLGDESLLEGVIYPNSSIEFELIIWLDYESSNNLQGKTYEGRIKIKANQYPTQMLVKDGKELTNSSLVQATYNNASYTPTITKNKDHLSFSASGSGRRGMAFTDSIDVTDLSFIIFDMEASMGACNGEDSQIGISVSTMDQTTNLRNAGLRHLVIVSNITNEAASINRNYYYVDVSDVEGELYIGIGSNVCGTRNVNLNFYNVFAYKDPTLEGKRTYLVKDGVPINNTLTYGMRGNSSSYSYTVTTSELKESVNGNYYHFVTDASSNRQGLVLKDGIDFTNAKRLYVDASVSVTGTPSGTAFNLYAFVSDIEQVTNLLNNNTNRNFRYFPTLYKPSTTTVANEAFSFGTGRQLYNIDMSTFNGIGYFSIVRNVQGSLSMDVKLYNLYYE